MRYRTLLVALITLLIAACAAGPDVIEINLSNTELGGLRDNPLGTYSDYGAGIEFSEPDTLHHYTVAVGGLGTCDQGVVLYARPKLDAFMQENQFSSYTVVKAQYSLFPLSQCKLFIRFDK